MKSITIETLFGKIEVTLSEPDAEGKRSGTIETGLARNLDFLEGDTEIDAIEFIILAHACAGVDVECPAYIEGINTALEAIDNNS